MPVMNSSRNRRFSLNVPCWVKPARAAGKPKTIGVMAETKDISRGGICFVADAGWKVGSEIECVIQLQMESPPKPPLELRCRGKIVRVVTNDPERIEVGATIEHYSNLAPRKSGETDTGRTEPGGPQRFVEPEMQPFLVGSL